MRNKTNSELFKKKLICFDIIISKYIMMYIILGIILIIIFCLSSSKEGFREGQVAKGDWLVGIGCGGRQYGGGCTPAETGYHYKGVHRGRDRKDYACWWHTKNQSWNTMRGARVLRISGTVRLDPR